MANLRGAKGEMRPGSQQLNLEASDKPQGFSSHLHGVVWQLVPERNESR